ncbi:hypothetical protein MKEN_00410000 [Mycena kentingensis (nom. inval.)]|nr:hypothetical protein MKEN_00410000 [Mycena kentingensis (nom. inval.)]
MRLSFPRHATPRLLAVAALATLGLVYLVYPRSHLLASYTPSQAELTLGHPTFAEIRELERSLPQHRLPAAEKSLTQRSYVYFPWEAWGTGWNNVFQEQLLNTHLAYLADRGYVFVDYIARDHPPFPDELPNGTRSMLHIPMNAFTSEAYHKKWWDVECPEARVHELSLQKVNEELGIGGETSGVERMTRWAKKLKEIPDDCVRVVGGTPFDYYFIISDKPASIWPAPASYGASPTLRAFTWSALVTRALIRNYHLFASLADSNLPAHLTPSAPRRPSPDLGTVENPYPITSIRPLSVSAPPIPGLLALHVRRGDYEVHCRNLAGQNVHYNTWNIFGAPALQHSTDTYPALPDYYSMSDAASTPNTTLAHCYPSIPAILSKIRAVRATPAQQVALSRIYIATNADEKWLGELVQRMKMELGVAVSTSRDLAGRLTREEEAVAQVVDMAVLTAAEVFIGNGWSSLTSNVVQLRLAGGRDAETCRFW